VPVHGNNRHWQGCNQGWWTRAREHISCRHSRRSIVSFQLTLPTSSCAELSCLSVRQLRAVASTHDHLVTLALMHGGLPMNGVLLCDATWQRQHQQQPRASTLEKPARSKGSAPQSGRTCTHGHAVQMPSTSPRFHSAMHCAWCNRSLAGHHSLSDALARREAECMVQLREVEWHDHHLALTHPASLQTSDFKLPS